MGRHYSRRVGLDIPRFWKEVARVAVPAVLAALISAAASSFRPFAHGGLASFMLGCLLYGLVYVLLEWLIGMNAYEKGLVRLCLGKARLHF